MVPCWISNEVQDPAHLPGRIHGSHLLCSSSKPLTLLLLRLEPSSLAQPPVHMAGSVHTQTSAPSALLRATSPNRLFTLAPAPRLAEQTLGAIHPHPHVCKDLVQHVGSSLACGHPALGTRDSAVNQTSKTLPSNWGWGEDWRQPQADK